MKPETIKFHSAYREAAWRIAVVSIACFAMYVINNGVPA